MRKHAQSVPARPLWTFLYPRERIIVLIFLVVAFFLLKDSAQLSGVVLAMVATYVYATLSLRMCWIAKSWFSEEIWGALSLFGMVISVIGIFMLFSVTNSFLTGLVFGGVMNIGLVMQMYANKFGRKEKHP